ncbi:MAG TPA: hypothetical protein VHS31_18205 [Tepidisphaeraceae bacterium]|jgi:hypothetical protein|nr:hypothetical protein [Tepidisphaeraceae bacterium]
MELQDFKRWHWALIALVIGAVLGYARTMATPDTQSDRGGISALQFITNVDRPRTGNGYQWVTNIRIYPAQTLPVPSANGSQQVNFVTCNLMSVVSPGQGQYNSVHFVAEIPFKVGTSFRPPNDHYTILDYLNDQKTRNPEIQYKYAWWTEPKAEIVIWMAGALVLIGGVWPTLINLMIGAGFAKPKTPKEKYDLDRFSKTPEPAAAVAKAGMSEAEADQLRQMQDKMEKDLAAAGVSMTGQPTEAPTNLTSGQIKTLTGTAAESTATQQDEEDKEYKGEFYPVVKPHHLPTEDEKKH